jgi:prepilin-type N-terminal cleavage/methylation domain-containing protein/prepilin-type processing-associated H-X9-DG protein
MSNTHKNGFTLIELLVVMSVISLLMAILMPSLAASKSVALAAVCKSNLRQLVIANTTYADDNNCFFVPAASDFWDNSGLHRWHGVRRSINKSFNPLEGPMAAYLANGQVKNCPQRTGFLEIEQWSQNFEKGCGGYGYNMTYIGSRLWQGTLDYKAIYEHTTSIFELAKPARSLMFADTAISAQTGTFIEYSFAEPPFSVNNGKPITTFYMSPSIHFRHKDYANIGWADGHVDQQSMVARNDKNAYGVNSADMDLGWFAPLNNSMFDIK